MQHFLQLALALSAKLRHAGICALVIPWTCCAFAFAQQADTNNFKRYPLRHKTAPEVSRMLVELLGNEVELTTDTYTNELLVRGGEKSQRIAQRLIDAVDQPKPQNVPARPASLKMYACPRNQLAEKLTNLRARYARDGSVRIAADPESGQLIVLAPLEVQAELQQELAVGTATVPDLAPEVNERFVPLPLWRSNQIAPGLSKLLGPRAVQQSGSRRGEIDLVVNNDAGSRVTLHVDESRSGVAVYGPDPLASEVVRLVQANDGSPQKSAGIVRSVSLRKAELAKVQEAIETYRRGNPARALPGQTRGAVNKDRGPERVQLAQVPAAGDAPPAAVPPAGNADAETTKERLRELGLDLDIQILPDLDAIILRGSNRDVNEVLRIIEDIERLSAETIPSIEVYSLKHVGSDALAPMLILIQKDLLAGRPGRISITSLSTPNALLLIGWGDAINSVKELIDKLDQPVDPNTQVRVFRLKFAAAAATSTTVQEFFSKRTGLGPKVIVTPDARSNALVVQAAPRDLAEVELLITRLDTARGDAVSRVRLFKLKNSLAANLATTLQAAIDSQRTGGGGAAGAAAKQHALELLTVDPLGEKIIQSGILGDVKITADPRANTLLVTAPAESMELVAALIQQMDDSPVSVAQIKVFHIVNSDAASLVQMLRALLPTATANSQGASLAKAEGEESFAPLRYSVEPRTNSIIATGSAGDLAIIEALLLRLDERDVAQRKNAVYRLKNEPALDVAEAINQFLRSERQLQQAAPGTISPFQQIESEVVVVPEPVGNSLIISATPRFFDEIAKLVEKLDAQPPQVLIQVLIAEVTLDDNTQFGVELGLQDSVLFDRSLLGTPIFQNTTTTFGNPPTTTQTQTILSATNQPGFDFNNPANPALGNSGSAKSLATAAQTGGQALSNFAVGRTSDLGFGGLVLSASSKGISALLRALQQNQRLDVLSRPQVMTMDNQPAYIQVGQKVPRVVTASFTTFGQTTGTELYDVGIILGVTPRISPDGMVVMDVDAIKSDLGSEAEGIPIAVSATGQVIRSPRINITEAHTTVSSADGETIILGGLITKSEQRLDRRVPYLADVPVLGTLFRYDRFVGRRTELLIILTPQVVRTPEDSQRLKQAEAARMHWCAADVHAIHGDAEFCNRADCATCNSNTPVIYPDLNPRGIQPTPMSEESLPEGPKLDPIDVSGQDASLNRVPHQSTPAATPQNPIANQAWPPIPGGVQTTISYTPPQIPGASTLARTPPASPAATRKGKPPLAKNADNPPKFDQSKAIAYPENQTSFSNP